MPATLMHLVGLGLILAAAGCRDGQLSGDGRPLTDLRQLDTAAAAGDGTTTGTSESGVSIDGTSADGAPPASGPPEQYPYDPLHFAFKQKIPAGVADDPRSAAIVARLDLLTSQKKVALSADGEVPPIYVVSASDALYQATVGGQQVSFRVPAAATAGGGSDHPLVLLDPLHPDFGPFTELRLWQASIDRSAKTLQASGAGLFHYNNDGQLLNPDGSPSIARPFLGWGTGSGLSILVGLIRPDEVQRGRLDHALRFNYSACHSTDAFRSPATKTDQPNGCTTQDPPSAMDMGMRLQLAPGVDCEARTVPERAADSQETRFLRLICHALQDYGMIMMDGTGDGGLLLMMESKATAGWNALVGAELWGSYGYLLRDQDTPSDGLTRGPTDGIPWDKMRVLAQSLFP